MSYDSTRVSGPDVLMDLMRLSMNVYDDEFLDRTKAGIISYVQSQMSQMFLLKWQMNGYLDVPTYHYQLTALPGVWLVMISIICLFN